MEIIGISVDYEQGVNAETQTKSVPPKRQNVTRSAARQKDCISGNNVDWKYIYIRVSATWNETPNGTIQRGITTEKRI